MVPDGHKNMQISLLNVKLLREKTGAGMVDCKNALEEAAGDAEKAIEILRKKGIAKAAKRSDREAGEGLVLAGTAPDSLKAYAMEINAETDFVVRSDAFVKFAESAFASAISAGCNSLEDVLGLVMDDGNTVSDNLANLSGIVGEKMGIKRFGCLSGQSCAAYRHPGGRLGVVVSIGSENAAELAYDIAMQIAATNPSYISPADVPMSEIEKEKEIYGDQLKKEGKPELMIERIIQGKLKKYFEDICLVEQEFIKEEGKKVGELLGNRQVTGFLRYSI